MKKVKAAVFILSLLISTSVVSFSQVNEGPDAVALEQLIRFEREHPGRARTFLSRLDFGKEGLEVVRDSYQRGDVPAACLALLKYYEISEHVSFFQKGVERGDASVKPGQEAVDALDGIFTLQGIRARQERVPDGGIDWRDYGPKGDVEWALFMNRHLYFEALWKAYRRTGNAAFAKCFQEHVCDWILSNPVLTEGSGGAPWKAMTTARRLADSWTQAFYRFVGSPDVDAGAKILMLSSIPDHAEICRTRHAKFGNHMLVEMLALATAAAYFPEFREAKQWMDYALEAMQTEMFRQVYPDGAQKELSNHYHATTTQSFQRMARTARMVGRELPPAYRERLEAMWNYRARITKPTGLGPLNNDADMEINGPVVQEAALRFKRPDWLYIATNGKQGVIPEGWPSVRFPWAGHVVMRSDWSRDALWAFFDLGPSGIDHQHYDRLHLSVTAYGRDLLVDTGRYHYKWDRWREYFVGPAGHNVVTIDGKKQWLSPTETFSEGELGNSSFVASKNSDWAAGEVRFEGLPISVKHRRSVRRMKNEFLLVTDEIQVFDYRHIEVYWHFHPECRVRVKGVTVVTENEDPGNLTIVPLSPVPLSVEVVEGQTSPVVQGWWSDHYNRKVPTPTVVYRMRVDHPVVLTWLLIPSVSANPSYEFEKRNAHYHIKVAQSPSYWIEEAKRSGQNEK